MFKLVCVTVTVYSIGSAVPVSTPFCTLIKLKLEKLMINRVIVFVVVAVVAVMITEMLLCVIPGSS